MDYSLSIKGLYQEITRIKSYSRLRPILRAVMFILMLPFTVATLAGAILYYALMFIRNWTQIGADELELWLNKRKEGAHFLPEAVLYFVTIPFIFALRVFVTIFSGILYIDWFVIMLTAFLATLGGIRWQPYLNTVNFDCEYTWSFGHSRKSFNVLILINIGLIFLCILQKILSLEIAPWLILLTLAMIYIVYPLMYTKKNLHEMATDEDIIAEAMNYAEVQCLANYSRAANLLNRIPHNETAQELASAYKPTVYTKRVIKQKIGKILMVALAILITLFAIVPPTVDIIKENVYSNKYLSYYANGEENIFVVCTNVPEAIVKIEAIKIREEVNDRTVTIIKENAFKNYENLSKITIPATIIEIGDSAFYGCVSLNTIVFKGTIAEWCAIKKGDNWNKMVSDYCDVICKDGTIPLFFTDFHY